MKKLIIFLIILLFVVVIGLILPPSSNKNVHVNSYTRSDGTKVKSHYRSSPQF